MSSVLSDTITPEVDKTLRAEDIVSLGSGECGVFLRCSAKCELNTDGFNNSSGANVCKFESRG